MPLSGKKALLGRGKERGVKGDEREGEKEQPLIIYMFTSTKSNLNWTWNMKRQDILSTSFDQQKFAISTLQVGFRCIVLLEEAEGKIGHRPRRDFTYLRKTD